MTTTLTYFNKKIGSLYKDKSDTQHFWINFVSSALTMIVDTITSFGSVFSWHARLNIEMAIFLDYLLEAKSFVPMCRINWSGDIHREGFI